MYLKQSRLLMRTICGCLSLIMLTSKSNSLLGIQGFAPYTSSCTYCCIDEHIYSLCKPWWHLHSHLSASSTGEEEHIHGICILISPSSTRERTAYEERSIPKTDQASTQQEMVKWADNNPSAASLSTWRSTCCIHAWTNTWLGKPLFISRCTTSCIHEQTHCSANPSSYASAITACMNTQPKLSSKGC